MSAEGTGFGAVLLLLGIAMIVLRKRLNNLNGQLGSNFLDPRLDGGRVLAAAERRRYLEAFPTDVGIPIGLASIAFGIATILTILPFPLTFTGFYLVFSVVLTAAYLRPLRTGTQRVASLVPRNPFSAAPAAWFIGAMLATALPLACLTLPQLRFPAALVACADVILLACAWLTANSRALIVGEDPEAEQLIDERLRRVRVRNTLAGTFVSSYAFCSYEYYHYQHDHGDPTLYLISWALFLTYTTVNLIDLRRGRPKNAV